MNICSLMSLKNISFFGSGKTMLVCCFAKLLFEVLIVPKMSTNTLYSPINVD